MRSLISSLSLVLCFCFIAFPAQAVTPVTLRPAVELTSPSIRLSDVFKGVPKEIDRDIALSPQAGQSVTYDVRVLTRLAKQYRLGWEPKSYMDHTLLTRAANYLTLEDIKPIVLEKLGNQEISQDKTYEIKFDNRSFSMALPANHEPDFKLINFTHDVRTKRFRGEIIAQTETNALHQTLSGRIFVKRKTPILARHIKAGTILSDQDFTWAWINEQQLGKTAITQISDLIGMEIRQSQNEGRFLRDTDIALPRLVLRGSLVTMKIQTPIMTITAQGRALQDGTKGDLIRIKNMKSQRVIEAVVEADGIVKVKTGATNQMAAR